VEAAISSSDGRGTTSSKQELRAASIGAGVSLTPRPN
jgi:hypothetical protein